VTTVLGIRHHGPGSARSVLAELQRLQPDILLVEGPADASGLIELVADPGMRPPVALLVYAPDEPRVATFYPLAEFSPEWVALRWALVHGIPARFIDLAAGAQFAVAKAAFERRTADAAGASSVVFAGEAVDPYNGKCVRAAAGSLFNVDVVRDRSVVDVVSFLREAGVRVLAATGYGDVSLDDLVDDGSLAGPTAWLFGSEAHGLSSSQLEAADLRVRVPIYGGAESLNLAAAAAVCLYASARAQR
jgi:tRNA(Leu) C34 or U34 (ribose-2'-O)-methylase TrmL